MVRNAPEPTRSPRRVGSFRRILSTREQGNRIADITKDVAPILGETLCDAVFAGLGVIVASTSDGGAFAITVLDGDQRDKAYASTADELRSLLEALRDDAQARMVGGAR